jgi:hypothetical protein
VAGFKDARFTADVLSVEEAVDGFSVGPGMRTQAATGATERAAVFFLVGQFMERSG